MDKFKAFYARAISDTKLANEVEKILGDDDQNEDLTDEQLQKLSELAKTVGFDISAEEFNVYLNAPESEELTDEELDLVVAAGNANYDGGDDGDDGSDGSDEVDKIVEKVTKKAEKVVVKKIKKGFRFRLRIGCFVGESKISTPDGFKLAKDIKLGDEVYTFDTEDNKIVGKVLVIHATADAPLVDVEFSNGSIWKTTSVQWFYCGNDDYACVTDTKGKAALAEDGRKVDVLKVTDSGEHADIYDFEIAGENILIVNGVAAEGYTGD